jgi:large subunit ribosomal protein L24
MNIKKDDIVKIISGKDRGKTGKVIHVFPVRGRITVDGVSMVKKHRKPRKQGEKGQIVPMPTPIDASNAMVMCSSCSAPVRIGSKVVGKKKVRVCKKCGKEM